MFSTKHDRCGKKIRVLEKRIALLGSEIRGLEKIVSGMDRKRNSILKRPLKKGLPESERRLVSYLSTGSFQTIDLRRHEMRASKVKRAIIIAVILLLILIIWIWFRG